MKSTTRTGPHGSITIEEERVPSLTVCPHCGAVLTCDWYGHDTWMVCFYCHHSVLVQCDVVLQ